MFSKVAILFLASLISLVVADTKTYTGPTTAQGDIPGLKGCVQGLTANPQWNDGYECGDHWFQLGGSSWSSAADCVGGCVPGLTGAAEIGADWFKCDQQAGVSAHCWVGWSPLGAHFCGNSDGSPCA